MQTQLSEINEEAENMMTEECDESWTVEIEKKEREKYCIYKLPLFITNVKKAMYTPRIVSFGPYHYNDVNTAPMEPYKHKAACRFLKRCRKSMEMLVSEIEDGGHAKEWMDAYDSLGSEWKENPVKFVEMMVSDGCFILEILRCYCSQTADRYAENDPIFSRYGSLSTMHVIFRCDMLMLENQLPISLLLFLHSMEDPQVQEKVDQVLRLAIRFCLVKPTGLHYDQPNEDEMKMCKHLLDVRREILTLGFNNPVWRQSMIKYKLSEFYKRFCMCCDQERWRDDDAFVIVPAVKLHRAGIKIRKSTSGRPSMVSGLLSAILMLPPIQVGGATEIELSNIMAFERSHVGIGHAVTSYICYMNGIMAGDGFNVRLLRSSGVIENHEFFRNDQNMADMFAQLTGDISCEYRHPLVTTQIRVFRFYQRRWNQLRENILNMMIITPERWIYLAKFGGLIFFGVTVLQTVYTVGQYYQKKP